MRAPRDASGDARAVTTRGRVDGARAGGIRSRRATRRRARALGASLGALALVFATRVFATHYASEGVTYERVETDGRASAARDLSHDEWAYFKFDLTSPADVDVRLEVLSGDADVYVLAPRDCASRAEGACAPTEGAFRWASFRGSGPEDVFISREDLDGTRDVGEDKYFRVGVHSWAKHGSSFTISVETVEASRSLVAPHATAMEGIFQKCCNSTGSDSTCGRWREIRDAGKDLCHSPLVTCTKTNETKSLIFAQNFTGNFLMDCHLDATDFAAFGASLERLAFAPSRGSNFTLTEGNSMIDALSVLPNLRSLDVSGVDLRGRTLDGVCHSSVSEHLLEFLAAGSNLTGSIPSCLMRMTNLEALYIHGNYLSGALPILPSSSKLRAFSCGSQFDTSNSISGSFPASYASSQTIEHLFLDNLNLSGALPDAFSASGVLRALDVSNNALTGAIPQSLAAQAHLEELYMNDNGFTGSVPAGLYDGPSRILVDLSSNQLTSLSVMSTNGDAGASLLYIDASNNEINETGIPVTLTKMPVLQELYLSNNRLHGEILNVPTLPVWNLVHLDVSDNNLEGAIPDESYWGYIFTDLPVFRSFDISTNLYTSFPSWLLNKTGSIGLTIRRDPGGVIGPTSDSVDGLTEASSATSPSSFMIAVFAASLSMLSFLAIMLAGYLYRSRNIAVRNARFQRAQGVEMT